MHVRETMGEASAGERIGRPLSRERHVPGAEADSAEGNAEGVTARAPERSNYGDTVTVIPINANQRRDCELLQKW